MSENIPAAQNEEISSQWQKKTALFLGGQCISVFGSTVVSYAIMWYLVLKTASGVMMTLYVLASFLPNIISAPFAGVLADRFDRKKLIIAVDGSLAIFTLLIAIIFAFGYQPLWLFMFTSFVRAVFGGLHSPAVRAVLPQIVPKEKLMKINGLFASLQSVMYFAAPAFGGLLLSVSTVTVSFLVDVATAVVGIGLLCFVKIPVHEKAKVKVKGGYYADIKEGVKYIGAQNFLRVLLIAYAAECVLIAPVSFLSPLYVTRSFGGEVWMLSMNEVIYSVGSMAGGFILAAWGGFKNKMHTLSFSALLMGVFIVLLGCRPCIILFFGLMLLVGMTTPWFYSSTSSIIQENVSSAMMGRVFAVVSVIGSSAVPLGMVLFGPLADIMSISMIFLICGILTAALGAWIAIKRQSE